MDVCKHMLKVTIATTRNKYINRFVAKYRMLYAKLQCLFKFVKSTRVFMKLDGFFAPFEVRMTKDTKLPSRAGAADLTLS